MRYVRTSDAKLAFLGNDAEAFQTQYIAEHSVLILEAAVLPRQGDSTWAKMPEIPARDRGRATVNSIVSTSALFGDIDPAADPSVPHVVVTI